MELFRCKFRILIWLLNSEMESPPQKKMYYLVTKCTEQAEGEKLCHNNVVSCVWCPNQSVLKDNQKIELGCFLTIYSRETKGRTQCRELPLCAGSGERC